MRFRFLLCVNILLGLWAVVGQAAKPIIPIGSIFYECELLFNDNERKVIEENIPSYELPLNYLYPNQKRVNDVLDDLFNLPQTMYVEPEIDRWIGSLRHHRIYDVFSLLLFGEEDINDVLNAWAVGVRSHSIEHFSDGLKIAKFHRQRYWNFMRKYSRSFKFYDNGMKVSACLGTGGICFASTEWGPILTAMGTVGFFASYLVKSSLCQYKKSCVVDFISTGALAEWIDHEDIPLDTSENYFKTSFARTVLNTTLEKIEALKADDNLSLIRYFFFSPGTPYSQVLVVDIFRQESDRSQIGARLDYLKFVETLP